MKIPILTRWQSERSEGEEGSALLVSLMVIVGLSLLGLGFVAISETESAISYNERNYAQTEQVAESGAKAVVEWFQDPDWADFIAVMPANTTANRNAFMVDRMIEMDGVGGTASPLQNEGKYKDGTDYFCCDRPFKPGANDRLYGTEAQPDIWIGYKDRSGSASTAGATFLDAFNAKFFPSSEGGRVTNIRIYAPPIVGGEINAQNFYNHNVGIRYGLATIMVTAEKHRDLTDLSSELLASRTVRIVISEWPFPGPQGPVQSNANIQTGGSVVVHWGKMTAQRTMNVKRPLVGLPWLDAYTRVKFEYGYQTSSKWTAARPYDVGSMVYPTTGGPWDWMKTAPAGAVSSATEPIWDNSIALNATFTDAAGTTWKKMQRSPFRINPTATYFADQKAFLPELLQKNFDDPWIESRARGDISNAVIASSGMTGVYHPFKYSNLAQNILNTPDVGYSNWFQYQTISGIDVDRKEVIFPKIDYQFWKDTAIAGQGQDGVYYLQWVQDDEFRDGAGTVKTFKQWTNTVVGAPRGFYFFDTKNGQNPQIAGGATFLTPRIDVSSSGGADYQMSGFVYINAVEFGTQGVHGLDSRYNFPGEPYRDIGYPAIDAGTGEFKYQDPNDPNSPYVIEKAGNGRWDYNDLDGDGKFDLFLAQKKLYQESTLTWLTEWVPVPWTYGCTPGSNGDAGANCSEPHEPYLNIKYPLDACCTGGSQPIPMQFGWYDPSAVVRRIKGKKPDGTLPAVDANDVCTNSADFDDYCTSNKYDRDGYYDEWAGNGADGSPVLDGVLYNEGMMKSQGNARYFGSVLINGDIDNTGTNEVWFDERLVKDDWPPREWPFPRVIVTAIETDQ